jgi:hypothetical protein
LLDQPEEEWSRQEYLMAVETTKWWGERSEGFEELDEAGLKGAWEERRQRIQEKNRAMFRGFVKFHQDRPLVDFIRVYSERDDQVYAGGFRRELRASRSFRGMGLSSLLYQVGAVWMEERGMRLYASGLQSEEAKMAWNSFRRRGMVREEGSKKTRRFTLDAEKFEAELQPLTGSEITGEGRTL